MAEFSKGQDTDAYVWAGAGGTNYGSATELRVGLSGGAYRSYMQWDLSGLLPTGAIISAASLTGAILQVAVSGKASVVRRVTSAWAESTITWNNKPGDTATGEAAWNLPTSGTTFTISGMEALVQDAADNRNGLLSVVLRLRTEIGTAALLRFRSRETLFNTDLSVVYRGGAAQYTGRRAMSGGFSEMSGGFRL